MRRADRLLIVSVVGLGIYLAVGSLYPESGSPLAALYNAFLGVSTVLGYPGAFIVSFLGNATILFPFPYMAI
ncbi:MAG: hypothetical protein ACFFCP_08805, partial [Promethearchaeota archaeon]